MHIAIYLKLMKFLAMLSFTLLSLATILYSNLDATKQEQPTASHSSTKVNNNHYTKLNILDGISNFSIEQNDKQNPTAITTQKCIEKDIKIIRKSLISRQEQLKKDNGSKISKGKKTINALSAYPDIKTANDVTKKIMLLNIDKIYKWIKSDDNRVLCLSQDFKENIGLVVYDEKKYKRNHIECQDGFCNDYQTKAKVILKKIPNIKTNSTDEDTVTATSTNAKASSSGRGGDYAEHAQSTTVGGSAAQKMNIDNNINKDLPFFVKISYPTFFNCRK